MRLVHSASLVFFAALALLPVTTADVSAQTFKPKFGTGSWTAFGSVQRPQDDTWQPGAGPGGEFWESPGGSWRPTSGSPIKNPRADTWTPVKAAAKPNKHATAGVPMHPTTAGGPASAHIGHPVRPADSHAAKTGTAGTPVRSEGLKAGAITMPDGSPIQFKQHGGPVITSVVVQAVFLGDWKSDSNRQSRRSQLVAAVDTIVKGSYLDALKPFYGVQHGSRDSDVDIPKPFNGTTISDDPGSGNASDLKKLITGWVGNGTLKPAASNRLYIMFLAPELSATPWANQGGFGYHSSITSQSPPIIYAVINTNTSFLPTSTASHEIAEAVTNPTGGG